MVESRDDLVCLLKIFVVQGTFLFLFYFNLVLKDAHNSDSHQVIGNVQGVMALEDRISMPVRLKIPKIGVDAEIKRVGVTRSGEMDVPSNASDVGWFELGPRPGQSGSAVIAGHLDDQNGDDGVFKELEKLVGGDVVIIENYKEESNVFIVRDSKTYDPGKADEVFGQSDGNHLNLITCDGVWDEGKKIYSKRLVVFADIMN